jgi:hypothetical protein
VFFVVEFTPTGTNNRRHQALVHKRSKDGGDSESFPVPHDDESMMRDDGAAAAGEGVVTAGSGGGPSGDARLSELAPPPGPPAVGSPSLFLIES